jgi:hypothetical protein
VSVSAEGVPSPHGGVAHSSGEVVKANGDIGGGGSAMRATGDAQKRSVLRVAQRHTL